MFAMFLMAQGIVQQRIHNATAGRILQEGIGLLSDQPVAQNNFVKLRIMKSQQGELSYST